MMNSYVKVNRILKTLGTINAIIKSNNQSVAPQTVFNYDSKLYKNSKSIANGLNIFFIVGPNLAEKNEKINGSILDTMNEPSKNHFSWNPLLRIKC